MGSSGVEGSTFLTRSFASGASVGPADPAGYVAEPTARGLPLCWPDRLSRIGARELEFEPEVELGCVEVQLLRAAGPVGQRVGPPAPDAREHRDQRGGGEQRSGGADRVQRVHDGGLGGWGTRAPPG